MKVALISDIHYSQSSEMESEIVRFSQEIEKTRPDVLIVAGDCAESHDDHNNLYEFLRLFRNRTDHGVSICIPGNHDLWLRDNFQIKKNGNDQAEEQYAWFQDVSRNLGWVCLVDEPYTIGNLDIVGNVGWYDFSSQDRSLGYDNQDYESYNWADKKMMNLGSSLAFCKNRMKEFKKSMDSVKESKNKLIVISHMVGVSSLMSTPKMTGDVGRAYFGNYAIGEMAVDANADLYFCGHSHERKECKIGNTKCINNGSTYEKKICDYFHC